jgi:hypothetical protein
MELRRTMPAGQGAPPDIQSFGVLATLAAALCVLYWRTALRVIAIMIIALAIYGAILFLEGLHHAVR